MRRAQKGIVMQTEVKAPDPTQAREFFQDKMTFTTGPVELERVIKQDNINVVDVRAAEDFQKGHIPGAINLPQDKWQDLKGLRKDQTNVLYCYSHVCHLAAKAAVEFAGKGFPVMEMDGGFEAWKKSELPIEK
jgi:rhodanese-related sulfurtransferase